MVNFQFESGPIFVMKMYDEGWTLSREARAARARRASVATLNSIRHYSDELYSSDFGAEDTHFSIPNLKGSVFSSIDANFLRSNTRWKALDEIYLRLVCIEND